MASGLGHFGDGLHARRAGAITATRLPRSEPVPSASKGVAGLTFERLDAGMVGMVAARARRSR